MITALVSLREGVDMVGVFGLTAGGAWLYAHLRRRDARRRVERKERQARYMLAALRRQREWDDAQRYFGTGR